MTSPLPRDHAIASCTNHRASDRRILCRRAYRGFSLSHTDSRLDPIGFAERRAIMKCIFHQSTPPIKWRAAPCPRSSRFHGFLGEWREGQVLFLRAGGSQSSHSAGVDGGQRAGAFGAPGRRQHCQPLHLQGGLHQVLYPSPAQWQGHPVLRFDDVPHLNFSLLFYPSFWNITIILLTNTSPLMVIFVCFSFQGGGGAGGCKLIR